ncbi:hypothetical protein Q757_03810 [Oenococcus alcoholitolerans]|uniref:Helicase ATP-binding domain-containing protein n=1 Tax=Oenococcus alcoholitolerans TaxID=931074 RepID=A0ABR4XR61_9LACO|nr:hypothetical protein Q757_03810 [Oenococcus alcoholitolerans]
MDLNLLFGRLISRPSAERPKDSNVKILPSFSKNKRCFRCNANHVFALPNGEYYCLSCLQMGRNISSDRFWTMPAPKDLFLKGAEYMTWTGELTKYQNLVCHDLIDSYKKGEDHLVWAVTGAGKTEMIFPLIDRALKDGKRVAMVSPRIDVILELAPRFSEAFSNLDFMVLYGDSDDDYRLTQFVLATTHQLLKFYDAFDLLIIDEVDSFPFRGDPMLEFACRQSRRKISSTIYLTATPTEQLIKAYNSGRLKTSFLPLRFHKHLLPEIVFRYESGWRQKIKSGKLPSSLKKQLLVFKEIGRRFLLFVPKISDLKPTLRVVSTIFSFDQGTFVHASDTDRKDKVLKMRKGDYQFFDNYYDFRERCDFSRHRFNNIRCR